MLFDDDRLYVRENKGKIYLISKNGYFQIDVESTETLPFIDIANQYGLYFELSGEDWYLKNV